VEYYDNPVIRSMTREAAKDDYRFSSLILAVVNSTPFLMRGERRGEEGPPQVRRAERVLGPRD
jgi:hypothetical protein